MVSLVRLLWIIIVSSGHKLAQNNVETLHTFCIILT